MRGNFFDDFTPETILKLHIFKKYIGAWINILPRNFERINIFDFFAGEGSDKDGNQGSPLIILDELQNYCRKENCFKNGEKSIRVFFNDEQTEAIVKLKKSVEKNRCQNNCCNVEYSAKPFCDSLAEQKIHMRGQGTANLVIMDQFGVKEVTPAVVGTLFEQGRTDILFFIAASQIKRFKECEAFKKPLELDDKFFHELETNENVAKVLAEHFAAKVSNHEKVYLTPFSIKKKSNIYAVIFGSKSLLGLNKFLDVCWATDDKTGEANANLHREGLWDGQLSLISEKNEYTKVRRFKKELVEFLECDRTNHELYEFILEKGFVPKKAKEILRPMVKSGKLIISPVNSETKIQKRAFYLGWEEFNKNPPKICCRYRD